MTKLLHAGQNFPLFDRLFAPRLLQNKVGLRYNYLYANWGGLRSAPTVSRSNILWKEDATKMEEFKVTVEGSGRHVHVTRETLDILFGKGYELTPKKMLSQPGQYASEERIDVIGPKGTFKNVGIIGPCRKEDQVEISFTDMRTLGIDAPIRMSGDLEGTPGCTLVGPKGSVEIKKGVIVAQRHLHCCPADAEKYGIKDGEEVILKVAGPRSLYFDSCIARVGPTHATFIHVDYDEVNAAALFAGNTYAIVLKKSDHCK